MRIIAIGDIHGRSLWASIVAKEELNADKIIFIGDYFDTFNKKLTAELQIENFKMIMEYKRQFPDKVVVLMGNHDFHYIMDEEYSGFQDLHAERIMAVVDDAFPDMHIVYGLGDFLFSHAGVTKTWCAIHGVDPNKLDKAEISLDSLRYSHADTSGYGEHISQSPIWVRPHSLLMDKIDGVTQVVGHTPQKSIEPNIGDGLILIDALTDRQYLIIEDGVPKVGHI